MAERQFTIGGKPFTLISKFTGVEEIHCNGVLVSKAGSLAQQFTGKRKHAFHLEGYDYQVTISDGWGPKKILAWVNGHPMEVVVGQNVSNASPAVQAALPIIASVVMVAWLAWPIFNGNRSGFAIGSLVGASIAGLAGVGFGVYQLTKKK